MDCCTQRIDTPFLPVCHPCAGRCQAGRAVNPAASVGHCATQAAGEAGVPPRFSFFCNVTGRSTTLVGAARHQSRGSAAPDLRADGPSAGVVHRGAAGPTQLQRETGHRGPCFPAEPRARRTKVVSEHREHVAHSAPEGAPQRKPSIPAHLRAAAPPSGPLGPRWHCACAPVGGPSLPRLGGGASSSHHPPPTRRLQLMLGCCA